MRWTESMTCTFVKLYAKHDCLWNPSDPKYKIHSERDKAYVSMSTDFHDKTKKFLSKHEVKNKIKTLRTTYLQQVQKILERSTPTFTYVPSLVWFETMDDILKNIASSKHFERKPSVNIEDVESSEVPTSTQTWAESTNKGLMDIDGNILDQEIFANEANPDPLNSTFEAVIKEEAGHKDERSLPIKKKKFKFKNRTRLQHRQNKSSNLQANEAVEDEFDIYGKYIASQLRKMELPKALRLQLAIQNLVSEARISDVI